MDALTHSRGPRTQAGPPVLCEDEAPALHADAGSLGPWQPPCSGGPQPRATLSIVHSRTGLPGSFWEAPRGQRREDEGHPSS